MAPAVSIIIPSYNRADVVVKTLDSIINQTFGDWECIVVDDRSTDDTEDVISCYSQKDSRIRYLLNTRKKGAQGARNTGLFASRSEWVVFFDSDNSMHPDFLQEFMAEVRADTDICKCFSNVVDVETGKILSVQDWVAEGDIHRALFDGKTYVDYNQQMIRREKLLAIEALDEECPSLQEFDTNIRLSKISKYHTVQKPLLDYYIGGEDTISANCRKQVKGKIYNLRKFRKDWMEDKRNADRFIYEAFEKIKKIDSRSERLKYTVKLFGSVPQMIPFYIKKFLGKI